MIVSFFLHKTEHDLFDAARNLHEKNLVASRYHTGSAWKMQITTDHHRSIIERWKHDLKEVYVNNIDL